MYFRRICPSKKTDVHISNPQLWKSALDTSPSAHEWNRCLNDNQYNWNYKYYCHNSSSSDSLHPWDASNGRCSIYNWFGEKSATLYAISRSKLNLFVQLRWIICIAHNTTKNLKSPLWTLGCTMMNWYSPFIQIEFVEKPPANLVTRIRFRTMSQISDHIVSEAWFSSGRLALPLNLWWLIRKISTENKSLDTGRKNLTKWKKMESRITQKFESNSGSSKKTF